MRYKIVRELAKYIPHYIWLNFIRNLENWTDEQLEKLLAEYETK